jgi:DNA polymerase-1
VAIAVRAPAQDEGELFAREEAWSFGAASGAEVVTGESATPDVVADALGDRPVIAHDAKALGTVPARLAHDSLLAAYLLDPARRAFPLAELCDERGLATTLDDGAGADAVRLQALAALQRAELADRGQEALLHDVELPLVGVLRDMERAGVRLNVPALGAIGTRVADEIAALERRIWDLTGEEFVIGSPQQLGAVLFDKLGLSKKRRGKTGFSTDARVLQAIRSEHEVVPLVERWRELNQLTKTYLDVLPGLVDDESRIHTTFVQAVASTGRLSSTNPNLQNVPVRTPLGREIRGCFESAPGCVLLAADYSQVELRVLAHVADEPVLKEIFIRGDDVHTATAREVFQVEEHDIDPGMRSKAKMINYGIVYGLTDFGLADRLDIPREEARAFIAAYLERFGRVHAFMTETIERASADGFVTTLYGRRRTIPELRARNPQVRGLGERLAVNTVVQGTAADVMKLAMIGAHRALADEGLRTRLILSIHDELLFEGPDEELDAVRALAEREMTAPWGNREPPLAVDVGVGRTWLEAK